jgi:hypothetical protein
LERRARAERKLNSPFELQPAGTELCERLVKVGDSVQKYRRRARQVIGNHDSRPTRGERDLGYPRAHRLDGEDDAAAEDVPVERDVALDVPAGHVQDVERLDRHSLIFSTELTLRTERDTPAAPATVAAGVVSGFDHAPGEGRT